MPTTKPENVIDLEEFRALGDEPDLKTLMRLSGKTAEVVVGLFQMVSNVQSQMTTLASRLEATDNFISKEETDSLKRISALEIKVGEVKSLLLQIADHLGVPHE